MIQMAEKTLETQNFTKLIFYSEILLVQKVLHKQMRELHGNFDQRECH